MYIAAITIFQISYMLNKWPIYLHLNVIDFLFPPVKPADYPMDKLWIIQAQVECFCRQIWLDFSALLFLADCVMEYSALNI